MRSVRDTYIFLGSEEGIRCQVLCVPCQAQKCRFGSQLGIPLFDIDLNSVFRAEMGNLNATRALGRGVGHRAPNKMLESWGGGNDVYQTLSNPRLDVTSLDIAVFHDILPVVCHTVDGICSLAQVRRVRWAPRQIGRGLLNSHVHRWHLQHSWDLPGPRESLRRLAQEGLLLFHCLYCA